MSMLSSGGFLVRRSLEHHGRLSSKGKGLFLSRCWLSSTEDRTNDTATTSKTSSKNGRRLDHDDDETSLIVSKFKNQIVHQLWTERTKAKKDSAVKKPLSGSTLADCDGINKVTEKNGKTPCQSETKVEYPFSKDEVLTESYKR
jgi:hypothetical protein